MAANFDALTGLPNRARFLELVNSELNAPGRQVTVMLVEVDRFPRLNQNLGHIAGDRLLTEIAQRLRSATEGQGLVSRFASDVFAVLTADLDPRALRDSPRV